MHAKPEKHMKTYTVYFSPKVEIKNIKHIRTTKIGKTT